MKKVSTQTAGRALLRQGKLNVGSVAATLLLDREDKKTASNGIPLWASIERPLKSNFIAASAG
jgi:hypothetical protein